MMDDLIRRQAAIDALAKVAREKFNLSDEFNHYLAGLMDGEYAIRQLPSAQPERPTGHYGKTGKWEHLNWGFDYDRCTECGYEHRYNDAFNYCPNCGCRMEVEHD